MGRMLAAVGIALVSAVFLGGVVVLALTLLGAREQQQEERRLARQQGEARPEALPAKQPTALLRQVSDAEIEQEIRGGRVFNAIKLYQEKTGVGPREARDAVEAWSERLRAS
jgi:ribosomal protein L7/L12